MPVGEADHLGNFLLRHAGLEYGPCQDPAYLVAGHEAGAARCVAAWPEPGAVCIASGTWRLSGSAFVATTAEQALVSLPWRGVVESVEGEGNLFYSVGPHGFRDLDLPRTLRQWRERWGR